MYALLNFGTSYLYQMMLNLNEFFRSYCERLNKRDQMRFKPVEVLFKSVDKKDKNIVFHQKCIFFKGFFSRFGNRFYFKNSTQWDVQIFIKVLDRPTTHFGVFQIKMK